MKLIDSFVNIIIMHAKSDEQKSMFYNINITYYLTAILITHEIKC